jgi:hypothetical protein
MRVVVDTTAAGARSGSVTLAYQSNGTGTSGLATIGVGTQTVNVSGNVYQAASGQILTAPLNFGTVQVGQSVSQALQIRNTAVGPAGFVEDLNASFGASSGTGAGLISGSGAVNGLTAANTNNGSMIVNVNTGAAGAVNGSIAVNYFSTGTVAGVSNGLGTLAVGSQGYGVQGTIQMNGQVVDQASPHINSPNIDLGNVRQGAASPTGLVSITNVATGNQQAALNASISASIPVTAGGSFNLLAPGATNNSNLSVGINTGTAGAISGVATIAFVSDASNIGGCAPNCQLNLASQSVVVSGAVYRLANPTNATTSVTLAARVGDTSPLGAVTVTNASPDIYTEALRVTAGVASSGFSVGANPGNIAAQSTGTLNVGLSTAIAGHIAGTLGLNYTSTGIGTTNAADIGVGGTTIALSGNVYTAAQAVVQNSVSFGIVHVGDLVAARGVAVQNGAAVSALNDSLNANIGAATGPFTSNGGSVSNLLAGGAANTSNLTVGLDTGTAGVFSGTAIVNAASHNPEMIDLALAPGLVSLSGQVNNYASSAFGFTSGAGSFAGSGLAFILDFGDIIVGSGALSANLFATNDAPFGFPADLLSGSFNLVGANDFGFSGFNPFTSLAAGGVFEGLGVSFANVGFIGLLQTTITLNGVGYNASGYSAAIDPITLTLRANVVNSASVPEPPTGLLLALALGLIAAGKLRRRALPMCATRSLSLH